MKKTVGGFYYPTSEQIAEAYRAPADPVPHLEYPWNPDGRYDEMIYTNNGSTASVVLYTQILKLAPGTVVYIPEYLCSTVLDAIRTAGLTYRVYRLDEHLNIDRESFLAGLDPADEAPVGAIFVIHYFGELQSREALNLALEEGRKRNIPVIEDVTMSAFSYIPGRVGEAEYVLASVRKFFPAPGGAVLAIRRGVCHEPVVLGDPYDAVVYHQLLLGSWREHLSRPAGEEAVRFLAQQATMNHKRYSYLDTIGIDVLSAKIMNLGDIERLKKVRVDNYNYFVQQVRKIPDCPITPVWEEMEEGCVPYGIQCALADRDAAYDYLTRAGFIPQVQWPRIPEIGESSPAIANLMDNTLMVQCDERLSHEDLDDYLEAILSFYNK